MLEESEPVLDAGEMAPLGMLAERVTLRPGGGVGEAPGTLDGDEARELASDGSIGRAMVGKIGRHRHRHERPHQRATSLQRGSNHQSA